MILIKHFNDIWKKMNKSFERFQIFGRENTEPNFFFIEYATCLALFIYNQRKKFEFVL